MNKVVKIKPVKDLDINIDIEADEKIKASERELYESSDKLSYSSSSNELKPKKKAPL